MVSLIRKFIIAFEDSLPEVHCWGRGSPFREFLHADDLGAAVVFALEKWDPSVNDAPKDENNNPLIMLNVGTGKDISIKELARKISDLVNFKSKII